MAEVLPEAERVLAAVQQVGTATALHRTSLAAPAALVSSAALGVVHGVGTGENVAVGKPVWPRQGQMPWLIFNSVAVDKNKIIRLQGLAERLPGTKLELD